jgi:hypothetical protein
MNSETGPHQILHVARCYMNSETGPHGRPRLSSQYLVDPVPETLQLINLVAPGNEL